MFNSRPQIKNCRPKTQEGVSLYLAFMAMSIILGIAFGMSALLVGQFNSLKGAGYSGFALEAADAGIEKIYYDDRKGINVLTECPDTGGSPPPSCTQTLANGASYIITVVGPGPGCPGAAYCAKSTGTFQSSLRSIRIAR